MALRGIRGAITVKHNTKAEIWQAAQVLLTKTMSLNELHFENVGAIIFTSTKDLTAGFPSSGVRQLPKFHLAPLFDCQETDVQDSLPMCIRVLILADVDKEMKEIHHVYLGDAQKLRPDLVG